jgi:class 3 adenylate cyclase
MASLQAWIGVVIGLLTVLGTVVAVTRHLTQVQAQAEREKLAAENRDLTGQVAKLEATRAQLTEQIVVGGRAGHAAMHLKAQVDGQLRGLMEKLGATGGSIYVPVRSPRGQVQGLAFLSIEPFRVETQQLRTKLIPLKSLAGRCFETAQSFVSGNATADPDHFKPAETLAAYRPATMLNLALKDAEGQAAGVLQLLSREGEAGFGEVDLMRAGALLGELPGQVADVARAPEVLQILGLGGEATPAHGTVLFFDLSRSSLLFEELSPGFAMQLLNEYFEAVCDVALKAGATLENYMGDGALLGFNVPRILVQHEQAACGTALAMNRAFCELKAGWTTLNPRLAGLHQRAGLSTGPLVRAAYGHSQAQQLTLLGYPIAVASALCNAATRDDEAVIVSAETWAGLDGRGIGEPFPADQLGKAAAFTGGAWRLTGLR